MAFIQEDFYYKDLYSENSYLNDVLCFYVNKKYQEKVSKDLSGFSKKVGDTILKDMWLAEKNPPILKAYSHWGERRDEIIMDESWDRLHQVSAVEGLVAIGYERESQEDSRVHQFLKLMLFHPSSAFYTCPLAMTDGACRVLELEDQKSFNKIKNHLMSRDPKVFWTAGQWMTEKVGGSDVSQSETFAEFKNGKYYLHGAKWFTSAITAQVAMTLAQTEVQGEKKLSLFLVSLRNELGQLNQIEVLRLKDKLGTKAMPTAELNLIGSEAALIGELGSGVKNITTVLNISRLYNSVCATGTMYRLHSLARDYSNKRIAFSKKLIDHPLHQLCLIRTQAITNASVHFCMKLASYLGASELKLIKSEEEILLRVMTPILKLWSAKKSVQVVSELLESFGGAGYIEDTNLPRFLRDAQVFPIWEGTTNVLSLDVLRAFSKKDISSLFFKELENRININNESFKSERKKIFNGIKVCQNWFQNNFQNETSFQLGARDFSFAVGNIFASCLMISFAEQTKKERDVLLAEVFINQIQFSDIEFQVRGASEFKKTLLS